MGSRHQAILLLAAAITHHQLAIHRLRTGMAMGRRLQAILRMATGHHLSLDPKRLTAMIGSERGRKLHGKAMRKREKLSSSSSSLKDQT